MGNTSSDDSRSRKWQITINNPEDKGFTTEKIREVIESVNSIQYAVWSFEVGGETGTRHVHIFLYSVNPLRFSKILKEFNGGHFEMAKGTVKQNREYVLKEGKWRNDPKGDTRIDGEQYEYGEQPREVGQGTRTDLHRMYDMIKEGKSNFEIIEENPEYITYIEKIEKARFEIIREKYRKEWRTLDVTYIWGDTGIGKTRGVMEKYGYDKVYRVTNYQHPFDGYQGEDVIVFEEFRDSLKIEDMLKYLDGYPCVLPCRFVDKQACFTKVYILSNIDIKEQYRNIRREYPETFKAFERRINRVVYMGKDISTTIENIGKIQVPEWVQANFDFKNL